MAEKQKIEIEIESKLLEQLKVFSKYMNQSNESLVSRILTKEIKYYTQDNFKHLEEFANDILFFDDLKTELKKAGAKSK